MSKNELSPAKKGRVTKLSQKSVNELINIILRKDDVERKQTVKIDELTKVISSKVSKYCLLDEKYQKMLKKVEDNKKYYENLANTNNSLAEEIDKIKETNQFLYRTCVGLGFVTSILIFVLLMIKAIIWLEFQSLRFIVLKIQLILQKCLGY